MKTEFEPTLQNLLNDQEIKWIFVGGKGGVGKTTTSSSIAIQFALQKKQTLIISTDPAHNLSDCFDQKFTKDPTLVNGFQNLFAIEIDPKIDPNSIKLPGFTGQENDKYTQSFLSEIISQVPGIDEAMSFAELVKFVEEMKFDIVVLDTAPSGHTLRLLNFPDLLDRGLQKMLTLKQKFSGIFSQFSGLFGENSDQALESIFGNLEKMKLVVEKVNTQIKDAKKTTFVCVCIPEFLSLYETERLIQELAKFNIDVKNIVVNQVIYPDGDCKMCAARHKMQMKYIDQIYELYEDFHIVLVPLQENEVRGKDLLLSFGQLLLKSININDLRQFQKS